MPEDKSVDSKDVRPDVGGLMIENAKVNALIKAEELAKAEEKRKQAEFLGIDKPEDLGEKKRNQSES